MPLRPGLTATATFVLAPTDTARAVGSGSLEVLGTPRLLAWCEAVTCAVLDPELAPGTTTVGIEVTLRHLAASPVGAAVVVSAEVVEVAGRRVRLTVEAYDAAGALLARGEVTRVVVDTAAFMARLGPPRDGQR